MGLSWKINSHYTALGDSISVGIGSSDPCGSFVQRYSILLEHTLYKTYHLSNFSKKGFTTHDVLASIELPSVRKSLMNSEIITITAGGNDLIKAGKRYLLKKEEVELLQTLKTCQRNISAILKNIIRMKEKGRKSYIIRLTNIYNPYHKWDLSYKWVNLFNAHMQTFENYPNVKVADIYSLFVGREKELLSWDSIHPNNIGHKMIAQAVYGTGFGPLYPHFD
ncbi:GDSL-type esterase/lipase family protein [Fictibacillus terranigra]|uniref:GDSL-type esterase/lipase family protein n=1 Tax=Fictibacillus terranigra TaxID=3058424 RepID=A0ABT8E5Q7_9BACL|nr:GDSL-type esterase/lipase family protein [Fictibacillus sp. CENA-BCM004]MDN4073216.1 GDSL-type esterase/lipase family protein [Fictibacillus sp. CENA-BCM004]